MSLIVDLSPDDEGRLAAAARLAGMEPAALARELLAESLAASAIAGAEAGANAASIALLESWLREDAAEEPGDVAAADRELAEFKQAIDAERQRAGARRLYR